MARGRRGDQVDHCRSGEEWPSAPVLADKAKEAVFNLVPLARARGKVTHMERHLHFLCPLLQGDFPQSGATPIAPATISGNEQFLGVRVPCLPHVGPPATN